jgi:periplasmic protein TonB
VQEKDNAMYADRYSNQNRLKPGSMALAIGMTALPIVGLVLSTAADKIHRLVDPPIETTNIPLPPNPPPLQPKIKPQPDAKTPLQEKVFAKPPEIDITPPPEQTTYTDVYWRDPAATPNGTIDGGGTVIDPPKPPPVIIDSLYDQRYVNALQPPYPPGEIRAGNEGRVVLRVLIGTDGRVKQVERVSATSDAFFAAAERQALTKWRFKPATRDGVPIEQWKQMSLRFTITDND